MEMDKKERILDRRAANAREARAYYKARNRCIHCHKQDAFTLNGRSYCGDCTAAWRKYYRDWYASGGGEEENARKKERRAKRRESHECTRCGEPLPAKYTYLTCDKCRASARNAKRKETERRTGYKTGDAHLRWQYGECWRCGKPVKTGLNANGQPFRMCDDCYASTMRGLAAARESNAERGMHPWIRENVIAFGNTGKFSPRRT